MFKHRKLPVLTGLGALLLGTIFSGFGAEPRQFLHDHVPGVVAHLTPQGLLPATNQLYLAIGVPLRDPAGLDQFLAELYNPASANYRHFLTPAGFGARFGATEADYAAVKQFALTNGFTITGEPESRLLLEVKAKVPDIERAFNIHLRKFHLPTENRDFFAPDAEPSVGAGLAIVDIQGLTDYWKPHPKSHRRNANTATPRSGSSPDGAGDYFGNDFRNVYAPGVTLTGAGQSVGLFQLDGYYPVDIQTYAQEAGGGRTNIVVQTVPVGSTIWNIGVNGGNGEVSLDIEMTMSMAPGLSKILVFEGPLAAWPNAVLSTMAASNTVKNLSSSWGWSGGPSSTTDAIYQQMAAEGQSFFNASGDSDAFTVGSSSANGVDNPNQKHYGAPSSCPYITQVGGTTLTTGSGAAYSSEIVWNWGLNGSSYDGSSGGVSSYYSIPSWQTGINMTANLGSTTQRNIPDVALTADDVYVISGGSGAGSSGWGGTSCAAPLWAGFTALINQQLVLNSGLATNSVGFINPTIYSIGNGQNPNFTYANCFHDITSGNNYWPSSPTNYPAVAGYDLCTGWGTPNGQNLINAFAPPPKPYFINQPASQNVTNGSNVSFNVAVGGQSPFSFQWLLNGAKLTNGGNVSGSASNILTLTAVTAGNAGGYSLVASNNYGAITSSLAMLNVGFAPVVTTQPTNLAVFSGNNAVFSAAASGSTNLIYQWFQNGAVLSNGTGVSGANSNVLTLTAVTTNNAGNYTMTVTNTYGNATSSLATLIVQVPPIITGAGWSLLAESATPADGVIDPGETVTVSFKLQNSGTIATSDLIATLQPNAGVLAPSGPQTYGVVAGSGGSVSQPFTFTAEGNCGSSLVAALQLQDGTNNLGTVNFTLPLGGLTTNSVQSFAQNFDSVTTPALPSGWTTATISGTTSSWVTTTASSDTHPNSVFISDIASSSENALVSPVIAITSASAQLTFRHDYSFDYHSTSPHVYRDGGVLEIKIGSGSFTDILAANGSFVTGGYNNNINTVNSNPLNGRSAWVGIFNTWQTVTVNLPASAAGQNIQLRWNCGTDSSNTGSGAVGWYVDSISITDAIATTNCSSVFTDLAASQSLAPISLQAGQNLFYTLTVTNLGPQAAAIVTVTDSVPANTTFVSASPGYNNLPGKIVWPAGMLPVGGATNFTMTLSPAGGNTFTNVVSVGTVTPEITTANNTATLVSTQIVSVPASISVGPASQSIQCGGNVAFTVAATGTAPLSIQWSLGGLPIPGATNSNFSLINLHQPNYTVAVTVTNLYGGATSNAMVTVFDSIPPVITLNGGNPIFVELGGTFTDPGATATDICAGVVPVTVSGSVNTGSVGTNTLIYSANDGNGNTNVVTRNVIVRDTTPPTILWSFTNLVLAAKTNCSALMPDVTGTNYILATDLSGALTISQSPTNNFILPLGTNAVVISVADASGNTAFSTNMIVVQDQTPPLILSQPQNQTNLVGTAASFSVTALACTPLAIQWFWNSIALSNQTNSTLTLASVNLTNAGNYSVTVTASGGSTNSAIVTLTVFNPAPVIAGVAANTDGSVTLKLAGAPGSTYVLEATTNLVPIVVWLPIATNQIDTSGVWQFTDPQAVNFEQQFYRLELAP